MATTCIEVETVIKGYHVYKEIWTAMLGEVLTCTREADNFHDQFAVAIMKRSDVVGHVPKKISTICLLFLRSGTITCEVNGSRQYSADLHQGGLEVPCKLRFACCDQELLTKTQKLLFLALQKGDSETPLKKIKLQPVETPEEVTVDDIKGVMPSAVILDDAQEHGSSLDFIMVTRNNLDLEWVKNGRISLLASHKKKILNEDDELDDAIMTFAQGYLKSNFQILMDCKILYCKERNKLMQVGYNDCR